MSSPLNPRSLGTRAAALFDWLLPRAHWGLLAGMLVVGLAVSRDYGQSWDERDIYAYGTHSVQAYQHFGEPAAPTSY